MSSRSAFIREQNNTMPGSSRTQQRIEALYNVVTDYPQYDLHFAAASGNLGLVTYALSQGQPVNSVLNGVLPLHAASAGGSEVVVDCLIQHGADVNAPRLPRRFANTAVDAHAHVHHTHHHHHPHLPGAASSSSSTSSTATLKRNKESPISLGASGSTPLHFAAANGHLGVVRILLGNGAVPDRPDKHNVTPEMLARDHGWLECADLLKEWAGGREDDLPPIAPAFPVKEGTGSAVATVSSSPEADTEAEIECALSAKKLHMKRSIDNALGLFKSASTSSAGGAGSGQKLSLHLHHHASHGQLRLPPSPLRTTHSTPNTTPNANAGAGAPPSPGFSKPFGEYTFYAPVAQEEVPAYRRPSLPHLFHSSHSLTAQGDQQQQYQPHQYQQYQQQQTMQPPRRQASMSAAAGYVYGRRPRSSEGGAQHRQMQMQIQPQPVPVQTQAQPPRKLSSKISLRNLFKRANTTSSSEGVASVGSSSPGPGPATGADIIDFGGQVYSSPSASPIPIPVSAHQMSLSPGHGNHHARSVSSSPPASSPSASRLGTLRQAQRPGLSPVPVAVSRRAAGAASSSESSSSSSVTPPASPIGTSGPGSWYRQRLGSESIPAAPAGGAAVPSAVDLHRQLSIERLFENDVTGSHPSPYRHHHHHRQQRHQHQRAGSSSSSSPSPAPSTPAGLRALRFDSSPSSPPPLASHGYGYRMAGAAGSGVPSRLRGSSVSSLSGVQAATTTTTSAEMGLGVQAPESAPPLTTRFVSGGGGDGDGTSFAEEEEAEAGSVSPGSSYAFVDYPPPAGHGQGPAPAEGGEEDPSAKTTVLTKGGAGEKEDGQGRGRGMSISSVDTEESANALWSRSQSSSAYTLPSPVTVPSPASVAAVVEGEGEKKGDAIKVESVLLSDDEEEGDGGEEDEDEDLGEPVPPSFSILKSVARNGTSVAAPLDLRGISNLAEAEALVARTRQEILAAAMQAGGDDDPNSPGNGAGDGIPLSARLAAFGELLALEKRFASGERQRLRDRWAAESGDEEGEVGPGMGAKKVSLVTPKTKRTRGAAGAVVPKSARNVDAMKKAPKVKRPHTAEGASRGDWGKAASLDGDEAEVGPASLGKQESPTPTTRFKHAQSRSVSSPLSGYGSDIKPARSLADIRIVETSATPVESPQTPEAMARPHHHHHQHHHHQFASLGSTKESKRRDVVPGRSRTPDPELHLPVDAYTTGVPLVRVATAPNQESRTAHSDVEFGAGGSGGGGGGVSEKRAGSLVSRRMGGVGGAQKLARMGFSIDTRGHHQHFNHYSPPGSHPSSRSPSKARFGGIKSLVQSLKGKS